MGQSGLRCQAAGSQVEDAQKPGTADSGIQGGDL